MSTLRGFKFFGRLFRLYKVEFFLAVTLLAGALANADELRVVEVRRNIPLADSDPVYKDFYIAGPGASGLKQNLVVQAVRKSSMKDATGTQSLGEMMVPVGQLKVIFVQDNLAVAREYRLFPRSDLPMLEQSGIMAGDQIDIKNAFVDKKTAAVNSKPKAVAKKILPSPIETASITVISKVEPVPAAPGAVLAQTAKAELVPEVVNRSPTEAPPALPKKEGAK